MIWNSIKNDKVNPFSIIINKPPKMRSLTNHTKITSNPQNNPSQPTTKFQNPTNIKFFY
jgi:hypothetical protein